MMITKTLNPDTLRALENIAPWQEAADRPDPRRAILSRLGIPDNERVIVVMGFEGCGAHDFKKLEQEAAARHARLYIIDSAPEFPGDPLIRLDGRALNATVISSRPLDAEAQQLLDRNPNANYRYSAQLNTVEKIYAMAGQLNLLARIDGTGVRVVNSSRSLSLDGHPVSPNGQPLRQGPTITQRSHARSIA